MSRTAIKTVAVAATLATGLSANALFAGPAQANPYDCRIGDICVWEHSSYNGKWVGGGWSRDTLYFLNMNNKTTSIWNRTGRTVDFFDHGNYGGYMFSFGPGHSSAAVQPHHNDRIESYRVR